MSYAIGGALGALRPSVVLPEKDYRRDLAALPWLCSVFEARNPALLPPIGKRLNLDAEGGYPKKIMDATGTGNLKTWFFIQEVPPGVVYDGAIFGPDPFDMVSRQEGREVGQIVVRTGRHLGGLVALTRANDPSHVRLNAHTANLFGMDPRTEEALSVDVFALYDMQFTRPMELAAAAEIVGAWRGFEGGRP
ncbi:hypothetical protein [Rhabdonatronobacter sediminivivens]|nr:hypothetical protein [Rhabdonatronobacter sediminivivens]